MTENILKHPQFDQIAGALEADRGLPPGTLRAVAMQESGGNPNAVSPVGARGAFQFMPATAKTYNVDVTNPWDSLRGAADYLGDNMKKYGGNIQAALADYNGGPRQATAVLKTGKPTAPETQNYVARIGSKILGAVVPSANASEGQDGPQPTIPTTAAPAAPVTDLEKLKKTAAYKVTVAKQQGIKDEDIVSGLVNTAPTPIAEVVARNLKNGVSPAEIIKNIGGAPLADHYQFEKDNNPTTGMSPAQLAIAGAGKYFSDTGHGIHQLYERGKSFFTGDDSKVKELQAETAQTDAISKPLMDTTAGKVGYVAGAVAPALVSGGVGAAGNALRAGAAVAPSLGTSIATGANNILFAPKTGLQAAANGVVNGLTSATDSDEAGIKAPVVGGVLGGVVGAAANRLIAPLGSKVQAGAADMASQAEQHGLPLSAKNVIDQHGGLIEKTLAKGAFSPSAENVARVEEAIANQVGKGVGVEGATAIDNTLLATNPYEKFDALTKGVQVPVNHASLAQKLGAVLDKYKANTLTQNPAVAGEAEALLRKVSPVSGIPSATIAGPVKADAAFSPQTLQAWRSELGAKWGAATSPAEKQALGAIRQNVSDVLEQGLTPEQRAVFDLANQQKVNQLAIQNMVSKSNNTGALSPTQLLASIKQGGFKNKFLDGTAPYQDLAETAYKLYGARGMKELVNSPYSVSNLAVGLGGGFHSLMAKLLAQNILGKALNSQSKVIRNALTGNTGLQQRLAKTPASGIAAILAEKLAQQSGAY